MAKQNRGRVKATYTSGNLEVKITLEFYSWEEDGICYMYAPALDLTGYGYSVEEASDSFNTTLKETVSYMQNKGTTYDELERLGWMVNRKKKKVTAPDLETLMEDNDQIAHVLNKPNVSRMQEPVAISI